MRLILFACIIGYCCDICFHGVIYRLDVFDDLGRIGQYKLGRGLDGGISKAICGLDGTSLCKTKEILKAIEQ